MYYQEKKTKINRNYTSQRLKTTLTDRNRPKPTICIKWEHAYGHSNTNQITEYKADSKLLLNQSKTHAGQ